ncbi:MAG: WXG100 family type VII secretion target [Ferrimicrobium sp.]
MESRFTVVVPEVEALASTTREVALAIDEEVARLNAAVHSLVGSHWIGEDAYAFGSGFDMWAARARQLRLSLGVIADRLKTAGIDYQETNDAIAKGMTP